MGVEQRLARENQYDSNDAHEHEHKGVQIVKSIQIDVGDNFRNRVNKLGGAKECEFSDTGPTRLRVRHFGFQKPQNRCSAAACVVLRYSIDKSAATRNPMFPADESGVFELRADTRYR